MTYELNITILDKIVNDIVSNDGSFSVMVEDGNVSVEVEGTFTAEGEYDEDCNGGSTTSVDFTIDNASIIVCDEDGNESVYDMAEIDENYIYDEVASICA